MICSIRLLTVRYRPILVVGQIQPVVKVGQFVARNPLGRFHSIIKYGPLTTRYAYRQKQARYYHYCRMLLTRHYD